LRRARPVHVAAGIRCVCFAGDLCYTRSGL